ncbi:hypothetical protein A3E39_03055 [Candidatus Uhrbacteria bacterium RIFCSPHIGHO2_12_FULL_60_25]|uniref:HIT domain-containing protein n=1 Tax=Candidatus Uhrbacteria bacterium RIFCSPHIGHO2_12_FULL_60_25 TaxID=1802399 RepID=A0A1F7UIX6_9BACT|nr:MAG: hypothetical protein A3E39_03055 [Candidatus Uhrbacteria bacterium RIFCSPHIGHO2_12_FULL_60_25]
MDVSTYLAEGGTDIYCDLLVPRRVPVEVVFESPTIIAFWHSRPTHEYHFVVAPKRHVADIRSPDTDAIWADVLSALKAVLDLIPVTAAGGRVITNCGRFQQSKHLHFHVVGGRQLSS